MGKGDLRTKRGKRYNGSTGKYRPKNGKARDFAAEAKANYLG